MSVFFITSYHLKSKMCLAMMICGHSGIGRKKIGCGRIVTACLDYYLLYGFQFS